MDCIVCCDSMQLCAKYCCNHAICYKCATKLLFLYDDKQCPLCKSSSGKPTFKRITDASDEDNNECLKQEKKTATIEDQYAIYESTCVYKKVEGLILKKCKKCKEILSSNNDLLEHYKTKHSELLCDVCLTHGHQFWFECVLYKPETLIKHQKGALSELGFSGHIYCPHCSKYIFNIEEAKKHCHAEHQLCTVCDLLGVKFQFYEDYTALEEHYRARHYRCNDSLCVKNLCYVYAYKSELWTHYLTQHSLNIKLSEIETGMSPNPPVCSIGDGEEGSGDDLYRQSVNIVTPLINEPYFPAFSTNQGEESAQPTNVPSYMDRSVLRQTEYINNSRVKQLRFITKTFYTEINDAIEKYIEGSKSIEDMVKEIELGVGNQICLKILENVSFLHRNKEIGEFLKKYRQSVMFPIFKKEESGKKELKNANARKNNPLGGFKILDLSKKK